MHFVLKVRMWLPFFNNPGKLSSWNPVLVFGGSRFYLHLQMFPVFRIACPDIQKLSLVCTLSSSFKKSRWRSKVPSGQAAHAHAFCFQGAHVASFLQYSWQTWFLEFCLV